jgi:hypothetical protein
MASESVKILIEAEDLASAKIAQASQKIEQNVKNIKSVGDKAKKSTEFLGSIAGLLGGSEIAGFASQFAGLTEKVSQFSEVSKAGGAGALAFKAGLVAAAGAIAFSIGNAIGNAIFQVDKWNKEIEKATERANELKQAIASVNQLRFDDKTVDIELIRDPEEKKAAYQDLLAELKTNLVGVEQQAKQSEKAAKEWGEAWQITGDRKGFAKMAEEEAKNDRERLKALQEQAKEVERILGIETEREAKQKENKSKDFIDSLREQLALEKAIGDQRFELEAQKTAVGADVGVAADLLKQIEAQKQLVEADKKAAQEKEQKIKEEEASRKRIIDLIANENTKNQERLVLLNKGTEAAKVFSLVQQGVAQTEAERLAAESERISRLEKDKQNREEVNKTLMQPQEAFQSRFLTRGPMSNPNERLEKEAEKQTRLQEEQRKLLEALRENTKPRPVNVKDVRLEVVG